MKKLVLISILSIITSVACADEPPCVKTETNVKYAGPMYDVMAQIESGMSGTVLAAMDASGIPRMALFARLHRKRSGKMEVLSLKQRFPQRFVMGTPKSFDLRDDLSDSFLRETVSLLQDKRYQFIGEILLSHADKFHGEQTVGGERYVSPGGKNMIKLLSALENRPIPIMTHWEVYDWKRDWPAFRALYARFPQVTFIWPHAGFASAEQVETVMSL